MGHLAFIAWLACQSLDAGTTAVALQNGAREVNPLLKSGGMEVRVGVNVGAILALRHTKPSTRKVVAWSMAGSGCIAGTWNLTQLRRQEVVR